MKARGLSDEECKNLIKRTASGEADALLELYDRTSPLVYGLIQGTLPGTGAAEEVLLDAFTLIRSQARDYDPAGTSPLAWLLSRARTCAIERIRLDKPDMLLEGIGISSVPEPPAIEATPCTVSPARQLLVREALATLPPEERQVLDLSLHYGMAHGEIAVITSQPIRSVRAHIRQAMIRLSDALQPVIESSPLAPGEPRRSET